MGEWRPFLASGRLVGDYTPIRIYQEVAREMGRDPGSVVISSEDLGYLRNLVISSSVRDVMSLVSMLVPLVKTRIDPSVAREVYKRYLGVDVGEDRAVEMISELVAKWCIEAAELMGIISIKGF
ncbi:MAG: hypothetical protein QXX84_00405 [Sulfolobales archaeon]